MATSYDTVTRDFDLILKSSTVDIPTGWERTVHVSRCPALYSGRIFVPLCRELIIFVF